MLLTTPTASWMQSSTFCDAWAVEAIAHVPKMASGEISLARGIHCCPNFFCPTRVSTLCRTCVYVCICVYIYIYTYISDTVQTVYELPLVCTKQHCSETFLHKSERCEVLTGYLSLGRRSGGDWANAWHWAERFTVCFSNRKWQQPSYFFIAFLEDTFIRNIVIIHAWIV